METKLEAGDLISCDELFTPSPGRVTINDIARAAGVSKRTVTRVLNSDPHVAPTRRQRIKALIRHFGFVPDSQARGLALNRSNLIGFIYDNPNPQYIVNLQIGILDVLAGKGIGLVVHPVDHRSPDYIEECAAFVKRQKLFGAILPPSLSEDDALVGALASERCDCVRIASVRFGEPERMVLTHDYLGGRAAGRHLAALGHRQVGYISGPECFRSSHERRRGFEEGLAESGLLLAPECAKTGGYTFEGGVACGHELLAMAPRPTAIFVGNDEMAGGLYAAARKLGLKIPDELSVVGYDDAPVAQHLTPALTTIRLPTREMGRAAAQALLNEDAAAAVEFAPVLIKRNSAGPVPEQ